MTIGECEAEAIRRNEPEVVREDARRLDRVAERRAALTPGDQLGNLTPNELQAHLDEVDAIQAELVSLADDVEARTGVRPGRSKI